MSVEPKVANSLKLIKKQGQGKQLTSLRTEESETIEDSDQRAPIKGSFLYSPSNLQQTQKIVKVYAPAPGQLSRTHSASSLQPQASRTMISPAIMSKNQMQMGFGASYTSTVQPTTTIKQVMSPSKTQIMKSSMAQSQIATKEITYETQAVKTINYVQVPVYQAQVQEPTPVVGFNVELWRLMLLIKEKDLELEVFRAKAAEISKEPRAFVMPNNNNEAELHMRIEQLMMQVQIMGDEINRYKERINDLNCTVVNLKDQVEEREQDLDHHKRDKAKRAGMENPSIDLRIVNDLEERIRLLEQTLGARDQMIEEMRIGKSKLEQEIHGLNEKFRLSEQQKANLAKNQQAASDEIQKLRPFRELVEKLQSENKRLLGEIEDRNQDLDRADKLKRKSMDQDKIARDLVKENEALKQQNGGLAKEIEAKRAAFLETERDLQGLRAKLKESEGFIARLMREKEGLEEEKRGLLARVSNIDLELEGKMKGFLFEREALIKRKEELERAFEVVNREKDQLNKELQSLRFESQKSDTGLKEQLAGLSRQLDERNQKLKEVQQELKKAFDGSHELSRENDRLKLSLKNQEATSEEKLKGLSGQIDELRRTIYKYEGTISELSQKAQGLNQEISTLKRSSQNIESEVSFSFQKRIKELEQGLDLMSKEKGRLEKELQGVQHELSVQRNKYETEITRYKGDVVALREQSNRSSDWWNQERERLMREVASYQKAIQEINNKLEDQSAERQREIQSLRGEYENRILGLTKEKETLSYRNQALEGRIGEIAKENESKIRELNERLTVVTRERTVLQNAAEKEKKEEYLLDFQGKMKAMEANYEDLLNKYKSQIEFMAKDYDGKLRDISSERDAEVKRISEACNSSNSDYESQIKALNSRIQGFIDIEDRNKMLIKEIDSLKGRFREKEREQTEGQRKIQDYVTEIENLKMRIRTLEGDTSGAREIIEQKMLEIQRLKESLAAYQNIQIELQGRIEAYEVLEGEFTRFKADCELHLAEIARLKAEIEKMNERLIMYENKIAILSGEVNRLGNLYKNKNFELEEWKGRAIQQESTLKSFQTRVEEYENQMYRLTEDNTRALMQFVMVCADIEQIRGRFVERADKE